MKNEAADFLGLLRAASFHVFATGDRLFVQPRESLTAADVESVLRHKTALLQLLAIERMVPCEGDCKAMVDPQAGDDIRHICDRSRCPFKSPTRWRD